MIRRFLLLMLVPAMTAAIYAPPALAAAPAQEVEKWVAAAGRPESEQPACRCDPHADPQRQADIQQLHRAVMSVFSKQAQERLSEAELDRFFAAKLASLPPRELQAVTTYLQTRSYDPAGSGAAAFQVYWYFADTLQQRLSALPPLPSADIEALRQAWLAEARAIDRSFSQAQPGGGRLDRWIERMDEFFEQNQLEDIH